MSIMIINRRWLKPSLIALSVSAVLLSGCSDDDDDTPLVCDWPMVANADESECVEGRNLHVASPDWRDQIIYFLMIDRFNDGDSTNNDQAGYYNPALESHYSGGDLEGIQAQLDYVQALGMTSIWITPPVANQWWDPFNQFSGYHGYWARDFMAVDEHYGDLEHYKNLSHALHENGMYLIQDIVANHTGNFFRYDGAYNPDDTAENFLIVPDNVPVTAPIQAPFDQNDRNNADHVAADIYHWTPDINDYQDPAQELGYQLSGLDDLNTENPAVLAALKQSYNYWISEVGVDAFRVDTAKFVDHDFWNKFFHDADGIEAAAMATGRSDFLYFGEVFEASDPLMNNGEQKLASYEGTPDKPEFKSLIGFPLYSELSRVFAEGQPSQYLSYRLQQHMSQYQNPWIVPNFVDNHDVARFLSKGSLPGLKQALTTILTIPGIPVIWQGTEQALTEPRQAMFAGGYLSEEDQFNTESEMFTFIAELSQIRTSNPIFTRGDMTLLADNIAAPGVLAFQRSYEGNNAFVIFNSADNETLLNGLDTGLPNGTVLTLLMGEEYSEDVTVGFEGKLTMPLAPRATLVLMQSPETGDIDAGDEQILINEDIQGQTLSENILLTGSVTEAFAPLQLVIDGNLTAAISFTADSEGGWQTVLPVESFAAGESQHSVEVFAVALNVASSQLSFTADVAPTGVEITQDDVLDDDNGPSGNYGYPQDASFSRQQDIESVKLLASGSNLAVTLTMREITQTWNPTNGFDHASLHLFFDLPGEEGLTVLPELNSATPTDFDWNLAHRVFGWNNLMYSTTGADADTRGENLGFAPTVEVDADARTITFNYDGQALGVSDWTDTKVYASTWDIDGLSDAPRALSADGGQWEYSGGDTTEAKIMDDITPITVPFAGVRVDDAANDEAYAYPLDESFGSQQDILQASATANGSNISLTLKMAEVTDTWNPSNGFDHVGFTIFIDLGEGEGATVMPKMNGSVPADMQWQVMTRTYGWNNAAYSANGASADEWGDPVTPAPAVVTDLDAGTVTFQFSSQLLGNPLSLAGVKIYVTTWDIDGLSDGYRAISVDGSQWEYGGGEPSDPKVQDEVLITLP
ncbi:alpha-amylase [Corallincola holothuriorum]|uniref:Alpha-amylase n=2 Tax=Corallincola holothuriorum TaxID=2282215 RepID=A0A368NQM1_9GAMM|nr:alpha-amylase [Corallincola holothuriorum]